MESVKWALQEIAQATGGVLHQGDPSLSIRRIYYDTRRIIDGTEGLFVALRTSSDDGHRYIDQAIDRHIAALLIDQEPSSVPEHIGVIQVTDTWEALSRWAQHQRHRFQGRVVGITGSYGKTIVKEWLFELLSPDQAVYRSPRSYNSRLGVSLALIHMPRDAQLALIEAGISRQGEMAAIARMIQPDIGVFTALGPAHRDGFPSDEAKLIEKLQLFAGAAWVAAPAHHLWPVGRQWLHRHSPQSRVYLWSFSSEDEAAFLRIWSQRQDGNATWLALEDPEAGPWQLKVPFRHRAELENVLTATLVLRRLGYNPAQIQERIAQLRPLQLRLRLARTPRNSLVIEDAYIADLYSLEVALDYLQLQAGHRPKALILSDLPDLDVHTLPRLIHLIGRADLQRLVLIGPFLSRQIHRFQDIPEVVAFNEAETAKNWIARQEWTGWAVLLKGSRRFQLERLRYWFQPGMPPARLEINLHALMNNVARYRSLLTPGTGIIAMVKALAYGSGDVEIARVLERMHVAALAVAYPEEGRRLRMHGIRTPIIVMNPYGLTREDITEYRLEPVLYHWSQLSHWQHWELDMLPVHLELDSGLGRLGFRPEEIDDLIHHLEQHPYINIQSVFSHLAAAEDSNQDAFTHQQAQRFIQTTERLRQAGFHFRRHLLNSAGTVRFPEYHFDYVRLGIGLYGIDPTGQLAGLEPVHTLKATILQTKIIQPGESVGYGRAFIASRPTRIGVLGIGYADGVPWQQGKLYGLIHGQRVPVLARPFMDLTAVDLSTVPDAQEGDEVILFGEEIPLSYVSEQTGESPYVLLSRVGQRVQRVYLYE